MKTCSIEIEHLVEDLPGLSLQAGLRVNLILSKDRENEQ